MLGCPEDVLCELYDRQKEPKGQAHAGPDNGKTQKKTPSAEPHGLSIVPVPRRFSLAVN